MCRNWQSLEVLQILRPFIPQLLESSKLKSPKH
ncbi:hypothetical protein T08_16812 [Trichinella sp. T8]|nr:hypothetical protein T08_16812 [Trichinella sp. T8]